MSETTYVKVVLYAYPKLSKLAEAAATAADNRALMSYRAYYDCEGVAASIVEEIATARRLLRLERFIEGIVASLGEEERYLLEYKYFRRRDMLKAFGEAEFQGSERSYFRKQNSLLLKLLRLFRAKGFHKEKFMAMFGRYAPFMRAYRAIEAGKERKVVSRRKTRSIRFAPTLLNRG